MGVGHGVVRGWGREGLQRAWLLAELESSFLEVALPTCHQSFAYALAKRVSAYSDMHKPIQLTELQSVQGACVCAPTKQIPSDTTFASSTTGDPRSYMW